MAYKMSPVLDAILEYFLVLRIIEDLSSWMLEIL